MYLSCSIAYILHLKLFYDIDHVFITFSGLSNLNMFIVVKTFPGLTNMVGDSGTFWLYSSFCFVMILYTLVWIPETKGRSLQDIEQYFNYKENLHVTPYATPVSTPNTVKKGLNPAYQAGIQFTL